jgi:hypothetical protein
MSTQENSLEEERWTPVAVVLWIATRSRRFMGILEGLPLTSLEDRLGRLQRENHSPHRMTLSNALLAFRQEVEPGSMGGLGWTFPSANNGTLPMFNIHELALTGGSLRGADVLRMWPDWPPTLAWNAAKARPWQAQNGIPKGWIRTLPAGDYLPFADVGDLFAFGRAKMAIGLSDIEEQAARLRAGIAIINAAVEGAVKLVGTPCERWPIEAHLLRQTGPRVLIGPEALEDLIPVPFGGRDWLGPRRYAEAYAEIGHAPQSVRFCDVKIERMSLLKWLSALSTRAPGLSEAEVKSLIVNEKTKNPSIGIGTIEQLVRAKDPLFPREPIRNIARGMGIKGRRGRPQKNSAG